MNLLPTSGKVTHTLPISIPPAWGPVSFQACIQCHSLNESCLLVAGLRVSRQQPLAVLLMLGVAAQQELLAAFHGHRRRA